MRTPARSPEDIIGIVPHTLGYTPRRSLVALIVGTGAGGSQTSSTTLRIDFDRETAAQIISEGGGWYANLVSRACAVTGIFLVVYDDDYEPVSDGDSDVGDEYAEVHRSLIRAAIDELALTFDARGIDTLSAWWVSNDRFGRIDADGYDSTPLIAATTSACATELVAGGSNPVGAPEELVIAPVSAEAFADSRRGRPQEWMDLGEAFAIFAELYPRLNAMRAGEDPFDRDRLHAFMDLPTVMALDALLDEKWSRDALEMILSFDHPNLPPARVVDADGERLRELCWETSRRADAAREIVGLSERAPHPRDVLLSISFLKEYLPLGHPRVRATAYSVIAWFEWALGGSTMAENYARAALELEPEHGLASLIAEAVMMGFLPRWLMDTEAAPF
ncbi:DUF4192 family protein [Brevibacterium spongiae]|uniref:DUF4192 domain-containing protein n=1 Tax=Brevibacterium spongiae TaxID=2909672 RepID=A0ABY5SPH8_9MICO|nr:DUF4192 family protein [Brevibacterium spongiae]UVI34624.1 DUF4192 domain-containing protein [Brevibacterium spongiae]